MQVSTEDGQAFAMGIGFEFCEVSALQSRNIDKPFKILANSFYNKYEEKVASLMEFWSLLKRPEATSSTKLVPIAQDLWYSLEWHLIVHEFSLLSLIWCS